MDNVTAYKIKTGLYALSALVGLIWAGIAFFQQSWILFVLGVAFAGIATDNVFCGSHAKVCGYDVDSHYVWPPFLNEYKK